MRCPPFDRLPACLDFVWQMPLWEGGHEDCWTAIRARFMATVYARISTGDQDVALQLDALKKAGCRRLFQDRASSAKAGRPGLAWLPSRGRYKAVDPWFPVILVVEKLNRLA